MNDGGPAFPVGDQSTHPLLIGMSLLDWFAGMALQGWIASFDARAAHPALNNKERTEAACLSYTMAEAMLAERERRMKAKE